MNQQQGLQILIQAAEAACLKGVFDLKNAKLVAEAVELFTKPQENETKKDDIPNQEKPEQS